MDVHMVKFPHMEPRRANKNAQNPFVLMISRIGAVGSFFSLVVLIFVLM